MNIWDIDRLILFVIVFLPGFVSLKIYDLLVPSHRRDFSKSMFDVIAYSVINFALALPLIYLIHTVSSLYDHGWAAIISLIIVVFIVPTGLPFLMVKIFSWPVVARRIIHPIPKPWDYFFGQKIRCWVIVHLKDGRRIGGRFDTNSFASSFPNKEQIYIEEVWKIDELGAFQEPINCSMGIIIAEENILGLEFFKS
jgi:hypothetical protein